MVTDTSNINCLAHQIQFSFQHTFCLPPGCTPQRNHKRDTFKIAFEGLQGIIMGGRRTMENLSVFLTTGWKFGSRHSIFSQNVTKLSEKNFRARGSKVTFHIA